MPEVISVIVINVIFLIGAFIYEKIKKIEEKKIKESSNFTVKMSVGIKILFGGWVVVCYIFMIMLLFLQISDNDLTAFIISESIVFVFLLLGLFGYIYAKTSYVIVKNDSLIINKFPKKRIKLLYEDIGYFSANYSLSCFDKNGIPILTLDHLYVGIERLTNLIERKGVKQMELPYPNETIKENKEFKIYNKKKSIKSKIIIWLIFAIFAFIMAITCRYAPSYYEFSNYEVIGIIDKIVINDEIVKIYLTENEKEYYINNIIYDALDEEIFDVIKEGKKVRLLIGYEDEYLRLNISEIEIDGIKYLEKNSAFQEIYNNYHSSIIASYAFLGIGIVLFIPSVINLYKYYKYKRKGWENVC